jgi:cytochrome c oxidase subunit III
MSAATPDAPVPTQARPAALEEHFEDLATQRHAAQLGMWIFLAGEVLLFSAMFALYAALRSDWPDAFAREAGETALWIGTAGTVVLLLASFLVAAAVHAIRHDDGRGAGRRLWTAALLGLGFLTLKLYEYAHHLSEGVGPGNQASREAGADAFWTLYYVMTGAHALHVVGGIAILAWIGWRSRVGAYDAAWHTPLELGGMYWHLVDVVWLFLWPCFYLMRS